MLSDIDAFETLPYPHVEVTQLLRPSFQLFEVKTWVGAGKKESVMFDGLNAPEMVAEHIKKFLIENAWGR